MRTRLGLLALAISALILGGSWWLVASHHVSLTSAGSPSPPAADRLPPCRDLSSFPQVPVQDSWRQVVTDYFAAKGMLVTEITPTATLLDVAQQRVGLHRCLYADGGEGAWTGSVPRAAIAAVQVGVTHDPYPVTGGSFSFLTLAGDGSTWSVVAEGTGP